MRRFLVLVAALSMIAALGLPAAADDAPDRFDRAVPESVADLKLDAPITASGGFALDASLIGASGEQSVIVRLAGASLAESGATSDAAQARVVRDLERAQQRFADRMAREHGAVEIARVQRVLNAVFLEVDASALAAIAADRDVLRVAPVGNYELDLSETVPYIGGSAVQAEGVDGSGIKVAVLDSGIDYTHASLGGEGTFEAYDAAYGGSPLDPANSTRDGLFPTARVVDGYDFVGELWATDLCDADGNFDPGVGLPCPLVPDDDPIDFEGHGTHVADIIGGVNGVAPGVDLYAVKVCASLDSACSGVALIQGMEFSVDPNMDGKVKDRVDIINMSLGAPYGQPFDDDLSAAVDAATGLGVLTVSSAGNGGNKPFIEGSPSGARTALSVAQTAVPSATLVDMEVVEPVGDAGFYEAVFQPWSLPLPGLVEGSVTYGEPGNENGCAPFDAALSGIVAVDRGACNFSLKIQNIEAAGGSLGIIMLIDDSDPFPGGFGGGELPGIPAYMISQAAGDILRTGSSFVRFDPSIGVPLVGSVVGSSSRGPQFETQTIKPEIGAPGASISAEVGTGTGNTPFGGTSGAAPMVAGSAALLLDAYGGTQTTGKGKASGKAIGHGLDVLTVKALLMNNGETDIDTAPGAGLAPISRIGGGEVRVDRALNAPVAAYDEDNFTGALGFGFVDVADDYVSLTKTVTIENLGNGKHVFDVTPTFRFADDAATEAISVSVPESVTVKPGLGRTTTFDVTITIDGSKLRDNSMNSGSLGANAAPLTEQEYDGYLVLDDGDHSLHLAWHVLPRKAAEVVPDTTTFDSGFPTVIGLDNLGVGTAQNDAYSLIAVSPDIPEGARGQQSPTPDLAAVGINTFTVPGGVCLDDPSFVWAFAVNTHERQTHAVSPGIYWFDLDTDQDGTPDYAVYNYDLAGLGSISDGRNVTWAAPYVEYPDTIGGQSAFFFTEHATLTGNTVLLVCAEQIGLTGADLLATNVDIVDIFAFDIYFGGPGDQIEGPITVTPLGERYFGVANDVLGNTYDPDGLAVYDFGPFPGNSDELGVMLFTNGDRAFAGEGRGGATEATETLLFLAN